MTTSMHAACTLPKDRRALVRTACAVGLALGSTMLAAAGGESVQQGGQDAAAQGAAAEPASVRFAARLALLDPLRPLDYLALGEEVADSARSGEDLDLARQLFGFAGALDTERLGGSAMLALAAIAPGDAERVRAQSAAELLGGRAAVRRSERYEAAQIDALARCFSFHRRGDGRRALSALKQNGAERLLERIGARLPGGAQGFRDECAAMRGGGVPISDPDMIRRQLELELAMRRGETRSLSLDVALDGDEPLPELDLADPKSLWGVDPSRAWWRNGGWSGSAERPAPPGR